MQSNDTSVDELQQAVEDHPYYAIAQLDLLRRYDSTRSPAFHKQAAKTALFFSNTYWLSWQLHPAKVDGGEAVSSNFVEEDIEEPVEIVEEHIIQPEETAAVEDVAPVTGIDITEADQATIEPPITDVEPFADSKAEINTYQQEAMGTGDHAEPELHEPEVIKEEIKVLTDNESPVAFEPLHTVDYFASQGIKITEEPISNDKLGKQMKSFTEWLKSMKKIHAAKAAQPDEQADRRIQSIADESNTSADVVTEAMAEVLEKQGRHDKAREMYHKLSLINPSKSAYFAAKIESLKEN